MEAERTWHQKSYMGENVKGSSLKSKIIPNGNMNLYKEMMNAGYGNY